MSTVYPFSVRIVSADGKRCDQNLSLTVNPTPGPTWANANTIFPDPKVVITGDGGVGNVFSGAYVADQSAFSYFECSFTSNFLQPWTISVDRVNTGFTTVILGGGCTQGLWVTVDGGIPTGFSIHENDSIVGPMAFSPRIGTLAVGLLGVGPHTIVIRGDISTDPGCKTYGSWYAKINAA